jgi:hypothetical protein
MFHALWNNWMAMQDLFSSFMAITGAKYVKFCMATDHKHGYKHFICSHLQFLYVNNYKHVRFQVLMAAIMKIIAFWHKALCSLI